MVSEPTSIAASATAVGWKVAERTGRVVYAHRLHTSRHASTCIILLGETLNNKFHKFRASNHWNNTIVGQGRIDMAQK